MSSNVKYENKRLLLAITFIVFALIVSSSIVIMDLLYFSKQAQKVALHNAVSKTQERGSFLMSNLEDSETSITALRESELFLDYLNHGNEELVQSLFDTYIRTSDKLMKLRYIDADGYEQIRIQRKEMGADPEFVEEHLLQDMSESYYFKDSLNKNLEEVWFSAIDINLEDESFDFPNLPTYRAILPLEVDNEFAGILVINYFAECLIEQLVNTPLYDMVVCNREGYVIYHYDSRTGNDEKNWGNMSENGYNISEEFPKEYQSILTSTVHETNTLVSRQLDVPIYDGVTLILQLRESYLIEEQDRTRKEHGLIILIIGIFSTMLTIFIVRYFSNVLLNLDKIGKLNDTLDSASKIAKIGFWEYDAKMRLFDWSNGVYDIFEINEPEGQMNYDAYIAYIPNNDREKSIKAFNESIENKETFYLIHKIISEKGRVKMVEERAQHYFDKSGKHTHSIGSIYDITEKYESESKFEYLLDTATDGIHVLDSKGRLIEFSHSFAENLGYTEEEMKNKYMYEWDPSVSEENVEATILTLIDEPCTFETKHQKKNGDFIDVQINAKGILYNNEKHLYASQRDITQMKLVQKELEENRKRWQFAVEGNKDGLWDWNVDTGEVYFSTQCRTLLGYDEMELSNSMDEWRQLVHPEDYLEMVKATKEYLTKEEGTYVHEHRILCKDGSYLWVRDRGITIEYNKDGSPHRIIGTISDITDHKIAMGILKEQTYVDELTGIHNRKAYNERLQEMLEQYRRYGFMFSLIMLDIDDFKLVNDHYGHKKGDQVLKEIATVIASNIRKNDYCFRIGGEEFIVLVSGNDSKQAALVADKIRLAIKKDVKTLKEHGQFVSVSQGVVNVQEGDTIDTIFKRADACMYEAKAHGKDRVVSQ